VHEAGRFLSPTYPHVSTACRLTLGDTSVNDLLDVTLQSLSKVLVHGRTTRKDNVLKITNATDAVSE
jgi:hypothetical protein